MPRGDGPEWGPKRASVAPPHLNLYMGGGRGVNRLKGERVRAYGDSGGAAGHAPFSAPSRGHAAPQRDPQPAAPFAQHRWDTRADPFRPRVTTTKCPSMPVRNTPYTSDVPLLCLFRPLVYLSDIHRIFQIPTPCVSNTPMHTYGTRWKCLRALGPPLRGPLRPRCPLRQFRKYGSMPPGTPGNYVTMFMGRSGAASQRLGATAVISEIGVCHHWATGCLFRCQMSSQIYILLPDVVTDVVTNMVRCRHRYIRCRHRYSGGWKCGVRNTMQTCNTVFRAQQYVAGNTVWYGGHVFRAPRCFGNTMMPGCNILFSH